jgi:hypothetical protein
MGALSALLKEVPSVMCVEEACGASLHKFPFASLALHFRRAITCQVVGGRSATNGQGRCESQNCNTQQQNSGSTISQQCHNQSVQRRSVGS